MSTKRIVTEYFTNIFDNEQSDIIFNHLRNNIKWEESIRSKKEGNAFTRLGKYINNLDEDLILKDTVKGIIKHIGEKSVKNSIKAIGLHGCYLNRYIDGTYWCPNHTHPGTKQIVVSFGAQRTLNVNKVGYKMKLGDGVIFGAASHGVPREEVTKINDNVKYERISIALFCTVV
jgi:hypothetical protein